METHAHELHKAPGHGWKHYFFEFFMLFLAVFCGFLAENFREHHVEKEQEEVYMKNMLEDLRSDTAAYTKYANDFKISSGIIDSLMYLLKSPEIKTRASRIYFLARTLTTRIDLLITNERTYDQMKSSGHLRLIHNQAVANIVSSYYNSLKEINNQNTRILARGDQYILTINKLFDAAVLFNIFKERKEPKQGSVKLLTEDPQAINEFLTIAQYYYGAYSLTQIIEQRNYDAAKKLMELIKKEYQLGSE